MLSSLKFLKVYYNAQDNQSLFDPEVAHENEPRLAVPIVGDNG